MSAARTIAVTGSILFLTGLLAKVSYALGVAFFVIMIGMIVVGHLATRQSRREARLRGRRR